MADKKQTQILLINDMAGYGKVALSVMIPVLSHLKFETFNLPTALVSNSGYNRIYGKYASGMEETHVFFRRNLYRIYCVGKAVISCI